MGMFDDITDVPAMNCRKCGKPITGWQSKDGPCELEKLPYWEVRNFYTFCHTVVSEDPKHRYCGEWYEYQLRQPATPRPITDYELLEPRNMYPDSPTRTSKGVKSG